MIAYGELRYKPFWGHLTIKASVDNNPELQT